MRKLYIVAPSTVVDASVQSDAAAAGCTEIVNGFPMRIGVLGSYPYVYTEEDDPEIAPLAAAVTVLRNQFQKTRTATQVNNALDAITVILRRIAKNEMDR